METHILCLNLNKIVCSEYCWAKAQAEAWDYRRTVNRHLDYIWIYGSEKPSFLIDIYNKVCCKHYHSLTLPLCYLLLQISLLFCFLSSSLFLLQCLGWIFVSQRSIFFHSHFPLSFFLAYDTIPINRGKGQRKANPTYTIGFCISLS